MNNLYKYFSIIAIISLFTCCAEDIVDVTGSISGIVKDYTTGLTVENCQVALAPSGNTVFTDANGRYTFDNLNPGTYTLTFTKIGYMDQSASVELLAGQFILKDIQLETTEAFTVSTSVLDFGDSNATLSFALQNPTATKYDFNIVNNIEWLKLSQTNGTIQANNKLNITATADRSLVGYGSYDKTITINYMGTTSGNVTLRIVMQKAEIAKPSVTTNEATDITANSFSIGGHISSTGGERITAYGHCWSYDPHPTIDNEHTDWGQTIENIRFNSKIYCSLVNTAVYVRAYAVNSQGVSYGNEVQVTTPKGDNPSEDDGEFAGGSGTAYDPYQIKTAASMLRMKDYPNAHFALAADIDMEGSLWIPIPMNTSFDGNNHTIYNLTINPYITSDKIGLFSVIDGGVVKNLTLHNVSANFPNRSYIGAIAGYGSSATITNCHVVLTQANSIIGADYVGGIIGMTDNINNCSVSSTVASSVIIGNSRVGGAIGHCQYLKKLSSIFVKANIAGIGSVGGIVGCYSVSAGNNNSSNYEESRYAAEKLSYEGTIIALQGEPYYNEGFGGLMGEAGELCLYNSKSNANIELQSPRMFVGGLIGNARYSMIAVCYSLGGIQGNLVNYGSDNYHYYTVGFNGYDNYGVSILNSYTLLDFKQIGYTNSACYSIYNLVSEFNSPINIAEIMRANCSTEASEYWDFNRTWTWKGTANGKTVTAICPKLKWEK